MIRAPFGTPPTTRRDPCSPFAPRCYAVDDPATFPGVEDWPALCNCSFWPTTNMACPTVNASKFDHAFEKLRRGETVPEVGCFDDDETTAIVESPTGERSTCAAWLTSGPERMAFSPMLPA